MGAFVKPVIKYEAQMTTLIQEFTGFGPINHNLTGLGNRPRITTLSTAIA